MSEIALIILGIAVLAALGFIVHQNRQQHLAMNSRMDQLLEATGAAREAKGEARGFAAGKDDHLAGLRKASAALDDESKHG